MTPVRGLAEPIIAVLRAASQEAFDLQSWEVALSNVGEAHRAIALVKNPSDARAREMVESLIQAMCFAHARLSAMENDLGAKGSFDDLPYVWVAKRRVLRLLEQLHETAKGMWIPREASA